MRPFLLGVLVGAGGFVGLGALALVLVNRVWDSVQRATSVDDRHWQTAREIMP